MTQRISTKQDNYKWMPFYPSDFLGDKAVKRCSWESKGVWICMLCAAWEENPRGVLPGNIDELADLIGGQIPDVSKAVKELEFREVFSRGAKIDSSLPADAIVSRRMYRDWKAVQDKAEAGRIGGVKSGQVRRLKAPPKGGCSKTKQNEADAKQTASRNPKQTRSTQSGAKSSEDGAIQDSSRSRREAETRSSPLFEKLEARSISATKPRILGVDPHAPQAQTEPTAVGKILGEIAFGGSQANSVSELLRRIDIQTGDRPEWMAWFKDALDVMAGSGGLVEAEDLVQKVEDCADPATRQAKDYGELKAPGGFLVSQFLKWGRQHKVKMPQTPNRKGAQVS